MGWDLSRRHGARCPNLSRRAGPFAAKVREADVLAGEQLLDLGAGQHPGAIRARPAAPLHTEANSVAAHTRLPVDAHHPGRARPQQPEWSPSSWRGASAAFSSGKHTTMPRYHRIPAAQIPDLRDV